MKFFLHLYSLFTTSLYFLFSLILASNFFFHFAHFSIPIVSFFSSFLFSLRHFIFQCHLHSYQELISDGHLPLLLIFSRKPISPNSRLSVSIWYISISFDFFLRCSLFSFCQCFVHFTLLAQHIPAVKLPFTNIHVMLSF